MPLIFYFLALLTMVGCVSSHSDRARAVAHYQPRNIYRQELPASFGRVALLPMVASPDLGSPAALKNIEDAISAELGKAKRFELISVSRDELHEMAGVSVLSSSEVWPHRLKQVLQEKQVDGVMVVELSELKGYHPLCLGLKMRLMGIPDGITYWSCDETFDAAAPAVYAAAKGFEDGMLMQTVGVKTQSTGNIELSPAKFAKYAANTLFQTLPANSQKK